MTDTAENYFLGSELDDAAQKAAERAAKLLQVAGRNPDEAASYIAKAQAIMEEFNLDTAAVEELTDGKGRRTEEKLKGGFFEYQRELWEAVAQLNFCLYENLVILEKIKKWKPVDGKFAFTFTTKSSRRHQVIGRKVNAAMTVTMAQYLETAIERALADAVPPDNEQNRSKWGTDFRKGCAERLVEKLYDRRRQVLSEERQKAEEARQAGAQGVMDGASTGRAVTLSSFAKQEEEANLDFKFGDGYSARKAKEDADRMARVAERNRRREQEWTAWCAANPEQYAEMQKEEAARERRNARRRERYQPRGYYREPAHKGNTGAFKEGYYAADRISIDTQADRSRSSGAIG
jgi:hypothetical protein